MSSMLWSPQQLNVSCILRISGPWVFRNSLSHFLSNPQVRPSAGAKWVPAMVAKTVVKMVSAKRVSMVIWW